MAYRKNEIPQTTKFLKVKRTGSNQSLALNTDVLFNSTTTGNVPYNPLTGLATLIAGETYKIKSRLVGRNDGSGTTARYLIYEIVTAVNAVLPADSNPTTGVMVLATSVNNEGGGSEATADFTPIANTDIKIRITGIDGSNWTLDADRSYLEITQMGSAIASTTPIGYEQLTIKVSGSQSTNTVTNDHVKFNTVVSNNTTSVTLDTTTAYAQANNVASLGRLTFQPGRTYELELLPSDMGGGGVANTGWGMFTWANADTGAEIEPASGIFMMVGNSFAQWNAGRSTSKVLFSPAVVTRVDVRITNGGGWVSYGGGLNSQHWYAKIRVVAGNPQFDPKSQSSKFILANAATNSIVTIGEIMVRYPNSFGGQNLEFSSSSSAAVGATIFAQEWFPSLASAARPMFFTTPSLPAIGTWLSVSAGGLGNNEKVMYEITTDNNTYIVEAWNRNDTNIIISAQKKI
jgi:hypothetical protein